MAEWGFSTIRCILSATQMEGCWRFSSFLYFFSFFFSWGLSPGWLNETGTLPAEGRKGIAIVLLTWAGGRLWLSFPPGPENRLLRKPLVFSSLPPCRIQCGPRHQTGGTGLIWRGWRAEGQRELLCREGRTLGLGCVEEKLFCRLLETSRKTLFKTTAMGEGDWT